MIHNEPEPTISAVQRQWPTMQNIAHELFLLSTSLSQIKSKSVAIKLFIESINNIFPGYSFSWSEEYDSHSDFDVGVCTRKNVLGAIRIDNSVAIPHDQYVLLQNAAQQLAILLEKLDQEILLNNQAEHLTFLVNEKTENLRESQVQLEEQAEAIAAQNEELRLTNIQLQKAKEKAEENDRLKTAFLQNISHEIRTPMNGIIGFAGLLENCFNDKKRLAEFTRIIIGRSNDLLAILNDIFDISKIESAQLPVALNSCNLEQMFSKLSIIASEHQKRTGKQQVKFIVKNNCKVLAPVIETDGAKLIQIFTNLISNAFKFTDHGCVCAGCNINDNEEIEFYVSDTGIGISQADQSKIFERFYQVAYTKVYNLGGTGLGLSIVEGLVHLLEGSIHLDSTLGEGSKFRFTIKYTIPEPAISKAPTQEQSEKNDGNQKTILIVEDDLINARFIHEVLATEQYKILHTAFGREAVNIAIQDSIDLILMDIRLPDIDGYEATREILSQKPKQKIIAQTAYSLQGDDRKALSAGCINYISKPINIALLRSMVKKHIST